MKIALVTDTHFGARNDNTAFADYFGKFYTDIFFPYLKENNINTIIHLGDIVIDANILITKLKLICKKLSLTLSLKTIILCM